MLPSGRSGDDDFTTKAPGHEDDLEEVMDCGGARSQAGEARCGRPPSRRKARAALNSLLQTGRAPVSRP